MHWWQSSSSPSSSRSHSTGRSFTNNKADAPPQSVHDRRVSYGTLQLNRIPGSRKLRNLTDDDDDGVSHPSALSTVTTHPLPLPDLAVVVKRDSGLEGYSDPTSKYILPLPESFTRSGENIIISQTNRCDWQGFRSPAIGPSTTTAETPLVVDLSVINSVHPLPLPPGAVMHLPSSSPPLIRSTSRNIKTQSQWRKGKLIGRGTFGSVYVGSNRETGALCAMKEVELCGYDPKSAECVKQLEQEINVLSQLKHPNIVQYYGSEIFLVSPAHRISIAVFIESNHFDAVKSPMAITQLQTNKLSVAKEFGKAFGILTGIPSDCISTSTLLLIGSRKGLIG